MKEDFEMKIWIKRSFLSSLLIALENWTWGTVLVEQIEISSSEAQRMMARFGAPADTQFGWASHIAYYKEYDHDYHV